MIAHQRDSLIYYSFERLGRDGDLLQAVSTRYGGVSQAPFATLNTSFAVGDEPQAVGENRRRLAQALGVPLANLVTTQQVHGAEVVRVDRPQAPGDPAPVADALITDTPGLVLSMRVADCVPVLLYDPARRAAGIAHAGWQGTVAGVAGATIQAMTAAFGTRPADVLAGIGPSVGPCCYAVGEDRAQIVRGALAWGQDVLAYRDGGTYLDLWAANRRQLVDAGLLPEHIELAGLCTACHTELFYSHRAEAGHTGRFMAVIGLREDG